MTIHHDDTVAPSIATARKAPVAAHPPRHEVTIPIGAAGFGRLAITSGVNSLALSGDGSLPDLLQARFEGQVPQTSCENGVVTIRYPRFSITSWISGLLEPTSTAAIVINGKIPWRIGIDGGVAALTADLRGIRLNELRIGGGASRTALLLPAPNGAVPVRFGDGVSQLTIHRSRGTPVRLSIRGGATGLSLDQHHAGAIGGEVSWQSNDFDGARDYYEIEIEGGARDLTIDVV